MSFCKNCGAAIPEGNKYCPECGQTVETPEQTTEQSAASGTPGNGSGYGAQPGNFGGQPDYQRYEQQYNQQYQQYQNCQQSQYGQQGQYGQPGQNYQQNYQQNQYGQYQNYQQPPYQQRPASPTSIGAVYSRSFALLGKKPLLLWGLSLLSSLLTVLAAIFGFIPLFSLPIIFVLEVGMTSVYLDAVRGKEINSDQLFSGFKRFFRTAGGMGWMYLWILIWSLIPIAGMVMGVIKSYSYRFVPYILLNDPDISATEALRVSMRLTKGYRGRMFLADLIIGAVIVVALVIFILIAGALPVLTFLTVIVYLIIIAFGPLVFGVISATYYDEIEKEKR